MRIGVQWTKPVPEDWQWVDHSRWEQLGDGPVHALNVQGLVCEGFDNYLVEHVAGGRVAVTTWNDDLAGDGLPMRWTFHAARRDNTFQVCEVWGPHPMRGKQTTAGPVVEHPLAEWSVPAGTVRRGVWVSDELHEQHRAFRRVADWQEWAP